jgi:hypothetical protein
VILLLFGEEPEDTTFGQPDLRDKKDGSLAQVD